MCNAIICVLLAAFFALGSATRGAVTTVAADNWRIGGPKTRLDPLTLTSANAVGLLTVSGTPRTHTEHTKQQPADNNTNAEQQQQPRAEPLKFVPTTISANSASHSLTTLGVLVLSLDAPDPFPLPYSRPEVLKLFPRS